MEFNLADLFEHAVDEFGDREYLIVEGQRRTYAQMEERANRLAHHLAAHGIGPGDHVGIYAYNSVEWVETLWAVFKVRAVWVNINYRYVEAELAYLFENADLKALVYQRGVRPRVRNVIDTLPLLEHSIVIEDGSGADLGGLESVEYEAAMASGSPARDFGPRSADDRYILYTGGTTGMPKGVVWRHEDVFYALGGGIDPTTNSPVQAPGDLVARAREKTPGTMMPIAPLMHGATQWGVMGGAFQGNRIVLMGRFDPKRVWELVDAEGVNSIMITGDAMGRPLAEALAGSGGRYDLSSLVSISSTAAVFSPSVKQSIMTSSRTSSSARRSARPRPAPTATRSSSAPTPRSTRGPTVNAIIDSLVLDEDLNPVEPGSGVVGKLARRGNIPLEYYKDPEKSAQTFVTAPDGTRYSMPGDFATVDEDGRIVLLGRGSVCINSGGEKIYPEEVEAAIKSHPDVYDCTVVGVDDDRWGSRVVALVQPRDGRTPSLEDIQSHCRQQLAGYKVPRELHLVDEIVRSPSGKPDYRWAKDTATGAATPA